MVTSSDRFWTHQRSFSSVTYDTADVCVELMQTLNDTGSLMILAERFSLLLSSSLNKKLDEWHLSTEQSIKMSNSTFSISSGVNNALLIFFLFFLSQKMSCILYTSMTNTLVENAKHSFPVQYSILPKIWHYEKHVLPKCAKH